MKFCLEKWGTVEVEGKKSAKKGTSAKKKWGKFKYKWGTKNNTPLFN